MATNYNFSIVRNGLVMYLDAANSKSYVSGSNSWVDISRNNNTGSLINGPTYTTASGGGIVFDGANDYVLTPLNIDANPVSVSAWCYPYNVSGNHGVFLTDNGGWDKGVEFNAGQWAIHNGSNLSNTGVTASANRWYNCCVVYATNNIFFYVNGNRVWTLGSAPGGSVGSTLEIGRANYSGGAGSRFYSGIVSAVLAYNRVLTDAEVLQNYNATKKRFGL